MMLAYHNDEAVKAKYIARVRMHRALDHLAQGIGWSSGGPGDDRTKGCAVGCTLEAYDHARYPVELGVPEVLARLEDQLFELQTPEDAMLWPERFLTAIPVGADLSKVWSQWAIWMLVDETHGVIRHASGRTDVEDAIRAVAKLHRTGGTPAQWAAAAEAAARAAAWAASSAAAWAARAAAEAAEAAAWAARAEAEARAWAAEAAEAVEWVTAACDKLITLLEAAR